MDALQLTYSFALLIRFIGIDDNNYLQFSYFKVKTGIGKGFFYHYW